MACGPIYERVFNKGVNRVGDNYSKLVTEVRLESFLEGWCACPTELGILEDNPAWAKATSAPEFPDLPTPYSLIILPSFDEEEYTNRPEEDEDVVDVVVAPITEVDKLVKEAEKTTAKEARKQPQRELVHMYSRILLPSFNVLYFAFFV